MEMFNNDGHLTEQALQSLNTGHLDELCRLEAAEHLSFCDECLLRYTAILEQGADAAYAFFLTATPQLLPPPGWLWFYGAAVFLEH